MILNTYLKYVAFLSFGLFLCKINYIVSVPAFFFNPGTGGQVHCTLNFSVLVHNFLTGSLYPNIFTVVLQLMWFSVGSTTFFGVYSRKVVCNHVCFYFSRRVNFKHFGFIFEIFHIVESFSSLSGIIPVCTVSFHSDVMFWFFLHLWYHMGLRFWCIRFYFPNFHF